MSKQIRPSLSGSQQRAISVRLGGRMLPEKEPQHAPMLGWYILVRKRTLGGAMGYSSGRNNSSLKTPSAGASGEGRKESPLVKVGTDVLWNGLPSGPWMVTSKYLRLSSCGAAEIPGRGSAIRRSVSCRVEGRGSSEHTSTRRGVLVLVITNLDYPLRSRRC